MDRFYENAFDPKHWASRRRIYGAYCSLDDPSSENFRDLLEKDSDLKDDCDKQIALLQMIGDRLPSWPPFRKRVMEWFPHAIVFLWVILNSYVPERRRAASRFWAQGFELLTQEAVKRVLETMKTDPAIVILDPDRKRAKDQKIPRERLQRLQDELEASLH